MDETNLRIDTYSPAVPVTESPETWPRVRVTHLPTGRTATASRRTRRESELAAVDEIRAAIAAEVSAAPRSALLP